MYISWSFLCILSIYPNFHQSNATAEAAWTVNTGKDDINLLGEVEVYDGMTSLPWWSDEYANMINGTGEYCKDTIIQNYMMKNYYLSRLQRLQNRCTPLRKLKSATEMNEI